MIHKLIGAAGFVLVILGIGCIDSPSLHLPITMIATGAVLLAAYAGRKQKWAEK